MLETFFLNSNANKPKLRVGVLLDSNDLISSFAELLRHIQASNFASLELVIRNAGQDDLTSVLTGPYPLRMLKILRDPSRRPKLFYDRYLRWDRARNPDAAAVLETEDCGKFFEGVPEVPVVPITKGFTHRFPPEAIAQIRSYDLDVMLRFGFNILRGEILNCARYGMWSYHHGDNDFYRGGPPHFWELVEEAPLSGVILQVLTETLDAGQVLAKTLVPTELGLSRTRNTLAPYRSAEPLAIWKLHQLHEQGWEAVKAAAIPSEPYQGKRKIYRTPNNKEVSAFLGGQLKRRVLGKLSSANAGAQLAHWRLGLRPATTTPPWQGSWKDFRWLDSPDQHRYLADPFLVDHANKTWLFAEDYDNRTSLGAISCAEVKPDGTHGEWRKVLERPFHLSFPFVFEQNGEMYMIPETQKAGKVELYRATDFPFVWRHERDLLDKPGADTVLHVAEDGTHYYWTSIRHRPGAYPSLLLFYSDGLREPWKLHPTGIVSADARYCRNGNRHLVNADGSLIRQSQDGSLFYGRQLHFLRIKKLNRLEYAEEFLGTRAAEWGPPIVGTHSFCRSSRWEVIDAVSNGRGD